MRVDLAFGFDNGYAPHVAAVIASALRYMPAKELRILLLNSGVTPDSRRDIEGVAAGATIHWLDIRPDDLPKHGEQQFLTHVNAATFLRLGLEALAPADCERVIYLDADVTVTRDLREMWASDLRGQVIGAVPDTFISEDDFAAKWNLPARKLGYFNAGVLLIDLKQVRAEKLFTKALDFIFAHNPVFADQDALNYVAWGRWALIDTAWNVQRDMLFPALAERLPAGKKFPGNVRPGVIHFTGPDKPWLATGWHPWAWLYWLSVRSTPFHRRVAKIQRIGLLGELRLFARWLRYKPSSVGVWP